MQWWNVGAVADVVIMVAYLAVAYRIVRGGGRLSDNPLATATAAIFFTCSMRRRRPASEPP